MIDPLKLFTQDELNKMLPIRLEVEVLRLDRLDDGQIGISFGMDTKGPHFLLVKLIAQLLHENSDFNNVMKDAVRLYNSQKK